MKKFWKISTISLFFSIVFLLVTAGNSFSGEYDTLKGIKSVKAVFDFELGNPKMALAHLQVIDLTFKDKNIHKRGKNPKIVVIFIGPSVKLVSKNKEGFNPEEQKVLEDISKTLSKMSQEGIKFEACLVAAKNFGVDPSTILPEVKKVGNGWISLIGHETKGYAMIPVNP